MEELQTSEIKNEHGQDCAYDKSIEHSANKCPTSVRLGDDFGYISAWATLPNMLTFWDGASKPYKWYQSHAPDF